MDVIKSIKIEKNKQDDLAFTALGVFALVWLGFGSIVVAAIITILFILGYVAYLNKDILQALRHKETEPVQELVQQETSKPKEDYNHKVILGVNEKGKPAALKMDELGHMFIAGMTRYGKTRLLHALIAEFIKFDPSELKLAFSDAKAVSFQLFSKSKHLYAPIAASEDETAALIQLALEEMYGRLELFKEYAEDDLCTNLSEYNELSGEKLPRLVIFFDELADSVSPDSDAEKNLTTLAKMGLAAGIHLVLSTQRPTKQGISHEVQTQCQTTMSTYMRNRAEYGTITKIPAGIYNNMRPEKGLFMVFSPDLAPIFTKINPDYEGWGFIKSNYYDNDKIKAIALKNRGEQELKDLIVEKEEAELPKWTGSEEDKFAAMDLLQEQLGREIKIEDMCVNFSISSPTARTWIERYYA